MDLFEEKRNEIGKLEIREMEMYRRGGRYDAFPVPIYLPFFLGFSAHTFYFFFIFFLWF
jgi:hypothetical protein